MVWAILGLVGAGVVLARLLTRRGRRQTWWVCATVAPASLFVGGVFLFGSQTINTVLQVPNLSILLYGLCLTVGSTCSLVFWHAVRHESPSTALILVYTGIASLVGCLLVTTWWFAPLHDVNYLSIREAPITPAMAAAAGITLGCWAWAAGYSGVGAWQVLRSKSTHHPAQANALGLFVATAAVAAVDEVLYFAAIDAQRRASPYTPLLLEVAKFVALLTVAGYGLVSFMAFVMPRLLAYRRAWRLSVRIRPLWHRVRDLRPAVALSPSPLLPAWRTELRLERMMTEIGDGLRQVGVAPTTGDPIVAVAQALAADGHGSVPATTLLPTPITRNQEEALFTQLALAYEETSQRNLENLSGQPATKLDEQARQPDGHRSPGRRVA